MLKEKPVRRPIRIANDINVPDDDRKLLAKIRKWVETDFDATEHQRNLEMDDLRFCDPETQWSDADRASRENSGRPVLSDDRLGPFLAQVINDQKKNKLAIQVNPVADGSDVATAEIMQGLIRHIEYTSNGDTAYGTAHESCVRCGRGFFGIETAYVDDVSLDQEIRLRRVENVHNVFFDPSFQQVDGSDAKWGGYKNWYSVEDYKELYPDSKLANLGTDEWKSMGDDAPEWMSKDGLACLVVECYYKEFRRKKAKIKGKERTIQEVQVHWVKCTALEILERGDWASQYIPIVPMFGKPLVINGQRTWAGLIRAGKGPQKRYNYILTAQVERIAFHPLSTWLGAAGFMGNRRKLWNRAHKEQVAALEYDIVGDEGNPAPPPQLISGEPAIMAITNALQGAEESLRAVMGMFNDPSRGASMVGQSGIAIGRLQQQADTSNFHFQDAQAIAQRHAGRIMLELFRSVYDTERVLRVIGSDDKHRLVRINGPIQNDSEAFNKGMIGKIFDLTTGKYDVTVSSGPSYANQREEERAFMTQSIQNPVMGQLIAMKAPDLYFKVMDSPNSKELADRLTPPQFQEQDGQPQIPPQMQAQFQALMQQHALLVQQVHKLMDEKQAKIVELQGQMEQKKLDALTRIRVAEIQAGANFANTQARLNADATNRFIDSQESEIQEDYKQLQDAFNGLYSQHQDLFTQYQTMFGQGGAPDGAQGAPQAEGAPQPSAPQPGAQQPPMGGPVSQ